jgi:ParB-like chromosome segregation protein Spo0J
MQIDERITSAFRQLTDGEFDTLLASIEEHGVLTPVIVWDEADTLVDGHHRVAIAEELGIEYPVKRMHFDDIDAAINFADRLQAGRRNESKEDRDERIRKMRAAGMTYQKIADEVGVGIATVHRAAKDVEVFQSEKLPGADGKEYPAHYKTRQSQDDDEAREADEAPPADDDEAPFDVEAYLELIPDEEIERKSLEVTTLPPQGGSFYGFEPMHDSPRASMFSAAL